MRAAQEDGARAVQAVRHAPTRREGLRPQHQERQAHRQARRAGSLGRPRRGHQGSSGLAEPRADPAPAGRAGVHAGGSSRALRSRSIRSSAPRSTRTSTGTRWRCTCRCRRPPGSKAKSMMLSTATLLSPADGSPVVAPTQDMVFGCFYLTLERTSCRRDRSAACCAGEDEAILAYQLRTITLHEPVWAEVRTWDAEEQRLVSRSRGVRGGRFVFNQILPPQLRYNDDVMKRSALKELVDVCYRLRGPEETAHLVDGIKSVGFEFATRGGLTITVSDIAMPSDKAERLASAGARSTSSTASSSAAWCPPRGRAGRASLAEDHERYVGRDDGAARSVRAGHDDDRVRRPRQQGQHRPAGRHARPHGRPVRPDHRRSGADKEAKGDDGPRVLHLDAWRPKGLADTALRTAELGA